MQARAAWLLLLAFHELEDDAICVSVEELYDVLVGDLRTLSFQNRGDVIQCATGRIQR